MYAAGHVLTPMLRTVPDLLVVDHLKVRFAQHAARFHVVDAVRSALHARRVVGAPVAERVNFVPGFSTGGMAGTL
jgi:hypothetical protein